MFTFLVGATAALILRVRAWQNDAVGCRYADNLLCELAADKSAHAEMMQSGDIIMLNQNKRQNPFIS